jgi:GTP cyclohydrolase IA
MNQKKIENLWTELLREIGENPDRIGLKDTPKRIAKMYKELFAGYDKKNAPKVTTFPNGQDGITYKQMIMDSGNGYSHCEHHGVVFSFKYYFSYIPSEKGKLVGLSKVARVIDYFAAKFQIQERLTQEVVDYLWKELSKDCEPPIGMALIIKGEHFCKKMRGVKKDGEMITSEMRGEFLKPDLTKGNAREEFLKLIDLYGGGRV